MYGHGSWGLTTEPTAWRRRSCLTEQEYLKKCHRRSQGATAVPLGTSIDAEHAAMDETSGTRAAPHRRQTLRFPRCSTVLSRNLNTLHPR